MGLQWKKGGRIIEARDRSGGRSSASPWTGGEWGSYGLELDDLPGSEVWALQDGRE